MKMFTPSLPFNVHAELMVASIENVKGINKKTYAKKDDIYISFKTFGGTETTSNGQVVVENTGVVQTWYRPDIKADCRLVIDGLDYEILGTPENINMSNQYLQMKVRAVKGGA